MTRPYNKEIKITEQLGNDVKVPYNKSEAWPRKTTYKATSARQARQVKIIKVLVPTPQGFVLNKISKPEHRKECFDVPQMESLSLVNCLFRFKEDL